MYTENRAQSTSVMMRVFLKADRALSKLNYLFHLKSKTNLVTLRKCNSHLQYYKVDLSFSIKLHEINLYVGGNIRPSAKCEFEYFRARRLNNLEREARDENMPATRADLLCSFITVS